MIRIVTVLILLLSGNHLFAQGVMTGKVTSQSTGETLTGVTVSCGTQLGTTTDAQGKYRLQLPEGQQSVVFRLLSYKTVTKIVTVPANGEVTLDLSLDDDFAQLGTVVISASKFEQRIEEVTVSMEVLKPYLIQNTNATSADQALDQLPGVSVVDGQANIRGGSGWSYGAGSRVQVMVDDLPILAADAGDAKWSFIPTENIEQAEVLKGASSVLYGSSALNGTINFRTGFPRDTPITKIGLYRGVYDKASQTLNDTVYDLNDWMKPLQGYTGVEFLHSRQAGNLDVTVGGNYYDDQGYRQEDWERRGRVNANLRYRIPNISGLSVGLNTNVMRSEGVTYFLWENAKAGAYLPAPNTASDYTTWRVTVDPFVTYVLDNGSSHKLRTRYFLTDNQNNTNQSSTAATYYAEYQYQHRFNDYITATGGLLYATNNVNSELYGDHTGTQRAIYVQDGAKWRGWNFSGCARAEKHRVDERNEKWTPVIRTGLNYELTEGTFLRASYGQAYRFPTVAELFVKTNLGDLNIFPNPDLQSETGWSAEIGVKQGFRIRKWQGYVDLAVFQNEYKNMMEFTFGPWGGSFSFDDIGFSSVNIGHTRIKGAELTVGGSGDLGKNSTLTVIGGYTYLEPYLLSYDSSLTPPIDPKNIIGIDSSGFLKYRFRHTFKMDAEFNRPKWMLGGSVRYTSYMENIDYFFESIFIEIPFPGFGVGYYRDHHHHGDAVFDGRFAWKFTDKLRLSLIVKNMFNNIYMQRPADMQAPRTFVVQGNISF